MTNFYVQKSSTELVNIYEELLFKLFCSNKLGNLKFVFSHLRINKTKKHGYTGQPKIKNANQNKKIQKKLKVKKQHGGKTL